MSSAGWPTDTLIAQLATLTVWPARVARPVPEHPAFEGELTYAGTSYPVALKLWANPSQVAYRQGPPAHCLLEYSFLEYSFPNGTTHQTEAEEQFLQDVGLVGGQFSLEVAADQNTMQWLGLDRHLRTIILRK